VKEVTAATIGILVFLLMSVPISAQDYRQDEVIVKFKSSKSTAKSMIRSRENRPVAIGVDDAKDAIDKMSSRDDIDYIEPNYIIEAETVPDDWPYQESDWDFLELGSAWDLLDSQGPGSNVIIAVVDSGVDLDHPELKHILIEGYDFTDRGSDPEDDTGHGTKVCGIIGANGNNSEGVAGVAWNINISIMPLKFMKKNDGKTTGRLSDAVDAIYYAVDNGADIINASWGFYSYSRSLDDALQYAKDNGVLFISSAGNSSQDNDSKEHYPSNYPYDNIIAVAAMDKYGNLAGFSNYGDNSVDLVAPGVGLKSTTYNGGYTSWASGTSYATPFVSSIAAMVISQTPYLTSSAVRAILIDSAETSNFYRGDLPVSAGCINAYTALMAEGSYEDTSTTTPPVSPSDTPESNSLAYEESHDSGACLIRSSCNTGTPASLIILIVLIAMSQFLRLRDLG